MHSKRSISHRVALQLLLMMWLLTGGAAVTAQVTEPEPTSEDEPSSEQVDGPEKIALEKAVKSLGNLPRAKKARNQRLLELEDQFEQVRDNWPQTVSAHQALAYRSECQRLLGRTRPAREGYLEYLSLTDSATASRKTSSGNKPRSVSIRCRGAFPNMPWFRSASSMRAIA